MDAPPPLALIDLPLNLQCQCLNFVMGVDDRRTAYAVAITSRWMNGVFRNPATWRRRIVDTQWLRVHNEAWDAWRNLRLLTCCTTLRVNVFQFPRAAMARTPIGGRVVPSPSLLLDNTEGSSSYFWASVISA